MHLPALIIALAPILVVAVLRLPLINQLDWADAWFYSGYAWTPKHHFDFFGFNYFAVRFPAVISIAGFENAFGPQTGYVLLRYLLAVATGVAVYALVRRFADRPVALATVLLLFLNPFFSRELLWDYSYFAAVSAGIVGIAVWWWAEDRHLGWSVLAGVTFAIAAFSHATFATTLFVLGIVELVAGIRTSRQATGRLLLRAVAALLGAALAFFSGYLVYRALLGPMSPLDILRPTIDFLRNNDTEVAPYVQSPELWLWHEPRIWAPVVLSVALIVVLRRRLLGTDLIARIAQLSIGFTAFVWLYRSTVTSSFIETWWSYNMTVVATAPAVGVLLHELTRTSGSRLRVAVYAVSAAFLCAVAIRNLPSVARDAYEPLTEHAWANGLFLGLTILVAVALIAPRREVVLAALATFTVAGVVMSYAPDVLDGRGGTGLFVDSGDRDWDAYASGHELAEYIRDNERLDRRILMWFPSGEGTQNIAWVQLPHFGHTVQALGAGEPLTQLMPLGAARLQQPAVKSVLVMSEARKDLTAARRALSAAGFGYSVLESGRLADGRLAFALLDVTRRP